MYRKSVLLPVAIVLGGCASEERDSKQVGSSAAPQDAVSIVTSDGAFTSVFPAILKLTPAGTELLVSGTDAQQRTWSASARISEAAVSSGELNVSVTKDSVVPNSANVRLDGQQKLAASQGSLLASLGKGKVSGKVVGASPTSLDAAFNGVLLVECWVPKQSDPKITGGTIDPSGAPALILDEALSSQMCAKARPWAK